MGYKRFDQDIFYSLERRYVVMDTCSHEKFFLSIYPASEGLDKEESKKFLLLWLESSFDSHHEKNFVLKLSTLFVRYPTIGGAEGLSIRSLHKVNIGATFKKPL